MPANFNYNRPKIASVNDTAIAISVKAAEKPNAPEELDGANTPDAGNTGKADIRLAADADESGGVDKQDLFKIEADPIIDLNGKVSVRVTVTPIKGDASAGTSQTLVVDHPETMDAWQTAAGRARQA